MARAFEHVPFYRHRVQRRVPGVAAKRLAAMIRRALDESFRWRHQEEQREEQC
jgi:hypothetical protein